MQWPAILDFMDKWGVPLILLLMLISWIRPKLDQVWNKALDPEGLDQKVIAHLKMSMDIDRRINEILMGLITSYKCTWATLWQYHNGSISLSGVPFLKVSATHQKSSNGNRVYAEGYQNIPTSLVFSPLIFKDCICVFDKETSDMAGITSMMSSHNIAIIYIAPVYNSSGMVVALLSISFDADRELNEAELNALEKSAYRVGNMLEVRTVIDQDSQPIKR